MTKIEEAVDTISQGRLIAVQFLTDHGRIDMELRDHPCTDAMAEGGNFAFFWSFDSCAHGIDVTRIESDGDETFIYGRTGEQELRIRISPVWLDEQREALVRWQKERDASLVRSELRRAVTEPELAKASEIVDADIMKAPLQVHGSYWAELAPREGILVTVGVLIKSKTKIIFRALPQHQAFEAEITINLAEYADRGFTPEEVFEYLIERANGVTRSLSEPIRVDARTLEDAAEQLLAKVGAKR